MSAGIIALDLFAGTGWGVACQRGGVDEHGVEINPAVCDSRTAAGMHTLFADVWDGLLQQVQTALVAALRYTLLIASPPCQTFTIAGKGSGRKALDAVLQLVRERAYERPADLRAAGAALGDDRTALVLAPLAYVWRDRPAAVVLEQVPSVLPVWEAYAAVMREIGYSVWTGHLTAEQYGVPQTRKRAFLIASLEHDVAAPRPTHSRYYSAAPARRDDGVLPWVSMAEALGWGMTNRPYVTITAGTDAGGVDPAYLGGSGARKIVRTERDEGRWTPPQWTFERPATTVTGDPRIWPPGHKVNASDIARLGEEAARAKYGDRAGTEAIRVTDVEAAILQSYPAAFPFAGNRGARAQQIGNAVPPLLAQAVLVAALTPAARPAESIEVALW